MRVAVWCAEPPAGAPPDQLDTLGQAQAVQQALVERGHTTDLFRLHPVDPARSLEQLCRWQPEVVFQLVEEVAGNSALNTLGALLLQSAGIPFTGSRAEVIWATTDKPAAKALLRSAGLPTPAWFDPAAPPGAGARSSSSAGDPGGRWLIKPARSDASIGIDEAELQLPGYEDVVDALASRPPHPGGWFAERYVHGREFNISLLQVDGEAVVLPIAEMRFVDYPDDRPRVVGYRAKWDPDSFEWSHTARSFTHPPDDATLIERLDELARDCWRLFRLEGYARVDFRVDGAGRPWILEINSNPGIAPDAGFAAAALEAGTSYAELVERIALGALGARP